MKETVSGCFFLNTVYIIIVVMHFIQFVIWLICRWQPTGKSQVWICASRLWWLGGW